MRDTSGLNRSRYSDAEWAQIITGQCAELVEFGMVHTPVFCSTPAPDDHVLCEHHQHAFANDYGRTPNPDGT